MNTVTHAGRQSTTAGVHGQTGSTSGAASASAQGTTGAAVIGSTTESTGGLQTHTATTSSTGDRARSTDNRIATTVGEKYKNCMATANTSSFAIYSNGSLYVLDQAGNDMVRQQMGAEAFRASMVDANGSTKWMTVTVQGTPNGESLAITSIRK
jgi:hypothetical protein